MNTDSDPIWLRPVPCEPPHAHRIAGGWAGFSEIDVLRRDRAAERLPADAIAPLWPGSAETVGRIQGARAPIAGLDLSRPNVMGIVNVTPDSFSDGGQHQDVDRAIAHGLSMAAAGADILDIGGESTRPGAMPVPPSEEADRVLPVIEGLIAKGCDTPISIDTRNAEVASAALAAGARIVNDVSAMTHDGDMVGVAARADGVCLMHALGDPRTMQNDPRYDDVLLDVFEYLAGRVEAAEKASIERARIIVDPGIGFGKTLQHNLDLIRGLSLFHGLGCPILLGLSRKGFIGRLSGAEKAADRVAGSVAGALRGVMMGAQILRVHDVDETVQALRVWQAVCEG